MNRSNTGMSLAELLVVISLLAIAASTALPAFTHFAQQNRLEALVDQLQGQLMHARATSVANNRNVIVCGSQDGQNCIRDWTSGWLVASPGNGEILSRHQLNGERIRWAGASQHIRFHSNGTTSMGNGRFYICDGPEEVRWQLILNRQGRIKRVQGLEKNQQVTKPCG